MELGDMTCGRFHSGATLREELDARGLSASALALKMHVPPHRLRKMLRGERAIAPETALRLSRCFVNEAKFCLNLQRQCDLAAVRKRDGARIASEVAAAA
jgi:addiction module HigA family antidote